MKVPFLDLKRQYNTIKEETNESILTVLDSQKFILGEEVEKFEENMAKYCKCRHAISVASGTDALLLSTKAHNISGNVLTSTFTFFATAGAIYNAGAKPQFVDIDHETFNIDPQKVNEYLKKDDGNVNAIIPVHLFGKPADMANIIEIAEDNDLTIIEDAAQTLGAEYKGKKVGSTGTACFSFFPSKNLGGFGDGGLITTNDEELAEKIRTLRVHGAKPKYYHHIIGYNSRLDAIHAAVLNVKLKYLDKWVQKRINNAKIYSNALKHVENLELPQISNNEKHSFNQYTIRVKNGSRDNLKDFLQNKGISTAIYYPLPLHLQPCFSSLNCKKGDFVNAELASKEVLSLPVFPELEKEEVEYTINSISEFFNDK
jgi:Predicted pyridoxal phosphate-dependent enzyme apparently involved in regulation of cell wall biogenesis